MSIFARRKVRRGRQRRRQAQAAGGTANPGEQAAEAAGGVYSNPETRRREPGGSRQAVQKPQAECRQVRVEAANQRTRRTGKYMLAAENAPANGIRCETAGSRRGGRERAGEPGRCKRQVRKEKLGNQNGSRKTHPDRMQAAGAAERQKENAQAGSRQWQNLQQKEKTRGAANERIPGPRR